MKCNPSSPQALCTLSNVHRNSIYDSGLNATIRVSKRFSMSTWKRHLAPDLRSSERVPWRNGLLRQMGVTQVNRSEKNASNREKYKTTVYKELQVVNNGWNLRGWGKPSERWAWKTKHSPHHEGLYKPWLNHD